MPPVVVEEEGSEGEGDHAADDQADNSADGRLLGRSWLRGDIFATSQLEDGWGTYVE